LRFKLNRLKAIYLGKMRGEVRDDQKAGNIAKEETVSVEKQQEILLMNKLASTGKLPPKPVGNFLQKKLQQRKFFDSGDYAMNQNKEKKVLPIPAVALPPKILPQEPDRPEIPSECATLPTLLRTPTASFSAGSVDAGDSDEEGSQLQIPRPDTVPQRKASILHPSAHSKLSPQPHIHHDDKDESINCHHILPPQ